MPVDYTNELSVTRKMGHTEMGDISEITSDAGALNFGKSINNEQARKELQYALG